jgi:hypothetical protein
MVCARCGHPLGLGSSAGRSRAGRRQRWLPLPRRWRLWFALAALVGVSTALAARGPAPRETPRTGPEHVTIR